MITVDLHQDYAKRALEMAIASLKRQTTNNINPAMKELLEKDMKLYQQGLASIKPANK